MLWSPNMSYNQLWGVLEKSKIDAPLPEQIKHGSTGSMLQEHFMISGTFKSERHTNKQPDLIINKIYEYH